jgi:hypothetical protein
MKLVKSPNPKKKWRAEFDDGTHTDFGDASMSDYTIHKDPLRRANYLARHRARENWNDYKSAGALSRWILWNKPTLTASLNDYKRRFNL